MADIGLAKTAWIKSRGKRGPFTALLVVVLALVAIAAVFLWLTLFVFN